MDHASPLDVLINVRELAMASVSQLPAEGEPRPGELLPKAQTEGHIAVVGMNIESLISPKSSPGLC
jgi:hypothetical protein